MSLEVLSDELRGVLAARSAELSNNGVGMNKLAEELSKEFKMIITRTDVISLKTHEKYKDMLMQIAEAGKLQLKAGVSGLVPDLIKCLGSALKDEGTNSVRAAAIVASVLTEKKDQDGPQQAQQLNITLATTDKTVIDTISKPQ